MLMIVHVLVKGGFLVRDLGFRTRGVRDVGLFKDFFRRFHNTVLFLVL